MAALLIPTVSRTLKLDNEFTIIGWRADPCLDVRCVRLLPLWPSGHLRGLLHLRAPLFCSRGRTTASLTASEIELPIFRTGSRRSAVPNVLIHATSAVHRLMMSMPRTTTISPRGSACAVDATVQPCKEG